MKACRDCGQEKSPREFSTSSKNKDGRTSCCRSCMQIRSVRYRDTTFGTGRRRRRVASVGHTWCPRCQQELSLEAFGSNRSTGDGFTAYCRTCHNRAGVDSKDRNGGTRNHHLRRRYGLTGLQVDELIAAQRGLCAVCKLRPPGHVDHDHVSGRVRGVLCSGCNQGLGNVRDDVTALRAAIDYLET